MDPLARITLAGDAPEELARLLSLIGIQSRIDAHEKQPVISVRIGDSADRRVTPLRLTIGPCVDANGVDFACDSAYTAACFIMSAALGLPTPFLAADPEMFSVLRAAIAIAPGRARVLIEGETGTGKQTLAKLIHAASGIKGNPINIDCAAIGSTGRIPLDAQADGMGREFREFDVSSGTARTVILDHVSELPLAGQENLLTLMRSATRSSPNGPSLRFIAATSRSLAAAAERGTFITALRDIFDVTLSLSPLRRRKDIPVLARFFLRELNPMLRLEPEAEHALCGYPFPGNVRELHNLITRLTIVARPPDGESITLMDVRNQLAGMYRAAGADSILWKLTRENVRRELALWALAASDGDEAAAARCLGVEVRELMRSITATAPKFHKIRGGLV